jgi:maleate isomerase
MKEHRVVRIGVIYPEDGVLDDEFWRAVPAGVTVHVTRARSNLTLHLGATYEEGHDRIAEGPYIDDAARTFTLIKPAAVAYACTSVSFARGPGYDRTICRRIQEAAGSPATTTATAMVAALQALGVKRVAVAAPYIDEVCARLRRFLEESGLSVTSLENLGLRGMAITEVTSPEVMELAKRADRPEAEALFLSCTNLRTFDVLEPLEQELSKPVISSNLATMWHAIRLAGLAPRLAGLGSLYRRGTDGSR